MKKILLSLNVIFVFASFTAYARESAPPLIDATDLLSAFQSYAEVTPSVTIPTVVEVPVSDPSFRRGQYIVYESTTKSFQPSLYRESFSVAPVSVSFTSDMTSSMGNVGALSDGSTGTSVEFPVSVDARENSIRLSAVFTQPMTVTGLFLSLEEFVALPRAVEVSAMSEDGSNRTVLSRTSVSSQSIRFPKTTASRFVITLSYIQPLRISEISFFDEDILRSDGRSVRFLARPGELYTVYFQADRPFGSMMGEMPNLSIDRDVKKLSAPVIRMNPSFRPADTDGDGARDMLDNCVAMANPDQADENRNGLGDVCDDYDKDGIINSKDNCPSHPNWNQGDTDHDAKGDVCDGEESRLTESRPWLPWVAMGFGGIVVVSLFVLTLRGTKNNS